MLTSIFSPQQCSTCKLCCNFHRSSSWETPFLEPDLVRQLQVFHVELLKRPDGSFTFKLPFQTNSDSESANCPMLDPSSGCRLPREQRPFECRIWPLRVMRLESGSAVLGCYEACPALDAATFAKLTDFAHVSLRQLIVDHAARFPQTIRSYHPHYRILEALPELDGSDSSFAGTADNRSLSD